MLFAAGYKLFGSDADREDYDIGAVYWQQALITTGTTALAFALAFILVGPWAGLVAALIVGTYPPLIGATGDQLSEPLGAFLLIAAFTVLALAIKQARTLWLYAAAGALFGLTILTRTDLLPVPFLIAGAMIGVALDPPPRGRAQAQDVRGAGGHGGRRPAAVDGVRVQRGGPVHPGHRRQRVGAVRRHLPARRRHDDGHEDAHRGRAAAPPSGVQRDQDVQDPGRGRARDLRRAPPRPHARPGPAEGSAQEPHPLLHDRARRVRADAVVQGQADVVLLLPRRRRALHLDADAHLAGRARDPRRPGAARRLHPDPPPAARRGADHDRVQHAHPHHRGLAGAVQRPADAVADRGGRRGLVPRASSAAREASEAETATMPAWNSEESASGAPSATAPAT